MPLLLLAFTVIVLLVLRRSRRLLRRLQRSEERFRAIYSSITEAIVIQEPRTGAILDFNDKALETLGYTTPETIVRDALASRSGVPPSTLGSSWEWLEQAPAESAKHFERQVRDRSGRVLWVEVDRKHVTIAAQDQVLVTLRDITERKLAEEALEESKERYRGLSEASFEAIFISEKGICLEQNQMAERMFGYSDSEAIGRNGTEWISPETRDTVLKNMLSGYEAPYEATALRKDGSTFPALIRGKMMSFKGRAVRVTSMSDITERKRTELQRELLYQVLRAVSSQLDTDLVVRSAVNAIVSSTGYPQVSIALPDRSGTHWTVRGSAGRFAAELGATYTMDHPVIGRALRTGQTQPVRSILDEPDHAHDAATADAPALRSEFVAPLLSGDHLLGALAVKTDRADAFNEADARMLQSAADMIALALENARLFGEAQQEITDRQRAEQELRDGEERLRDAQRLALIGHWELNLVTNRLTWSDEIYRIFQIDPAQFAASYEAFLDAIHPADRETVDRAYTTSLDTRSPYEIDHRLLLPSGCVKYVHERGETLYDVEGHPLRSVGTVQDITERKRAEQALRANEEKYRRLFDAASLGIFQATAEGQVISVNPALAHMLGYDSPEDAMNSIQNVATDLFADPSRRAAIIRMMADDPDLRTFENAYRRKDGTTFIGHLNVTPVMDSDGRLVRTEGMIEDISERKRAEAKLQATLEEKETLLREVHHRVKNNLQAMIALMEMRASVIPDEDTRQFLKELEGQARTMALVYEQLYQSVNLAHVQMAPYLQQLTFGVVDTYGSSRRVHVDLDVEPIALDVAQAMPCGLVVNELVTNMLKHAFPSGFQGQPTVSVTLQNDRETCRLTAADNGVGLPPGFDWHASRSLGLRLVNLWVTHQLGGTLNVRSDAGTAYSVTFRRDGLQGDRFVSAALGAHSTEKDDSSGHDKEFQGAR